MRRISNCFAALALLLSAACSTTYKEFRVVTKNTRGEEVPAYVVVDGDWPITWDQVKTTPATIRIPEDKERFQLTVKPIPAGTDPTQDPVPRSTDPAEYKLQVYDVETDEPRTQLVLVERNFDFGR